MYPVTHVVAEDIKGDIIRLSVKISKNAFRPLSISAALPEAGEKILVIGSPLGLEQTITDGIVSAIREIPGFGKVLQMTAPISHGSSGSPVVNMRKEVIGVVSFYFSDGQNLNFAIPGERVTRLASEKRQTFSAWALGRNKDQLVRAEEFYSEGLTHFLAGVCEDALQSFKKAVEENPRHADAYFQIGYCYSNLGRYNEAVEAYKQAIRIKPDDAEAHYNLGVSYLILKNRGGALEEYKILKELDHDLADRLFNLIYK